MKRFFIASLTLLVLVSFLGTGLRADTGGKDAMSSFMGAKWGVSIKDFKETFKHKDKISLGIGAWPNYTLRFFKLGEIKVTVMFLFYTKGNKRMKVTDENGHELLLRDVEITITPNQYESLLSILTAKYGKPDISTKLISKWDNKKLNRKIELKRYSDSMEYGAAWFTPIDPGEKKSAKEGADQL